MLSLERTLLDYDLQLLRAIAETAGVELQSGNARAAALELAAVLLEPETVRLQLVGLPDGARDLLARLHEQGGRAPVGAFVREYGNVRPLGPGARMREAPHLQPENDVEVLWYRALLGRAFADEDGSPQEYFYIPTDLLPLLPARTQTPHVAELDAASTVEISDFTPARSTLVDDACTLLAYLQRDGLPSDAGGVLPEATRAALAPYLQQPAALDLIWQLARERRWITGEAATLDAARVRAFLEAARGAQLQILAETWRDSISWHDLLHVPGLVFDTAHTSLPDPQRARAAVLAVLRQAPGGQWSSVAAVVRYIYKQQPDFQRPGGDYDSLYVRDARTREFLRGFAHWTRVDGALVRFLITGPLHWLGLCDIAPGVNPTEADAETAFRPTPMFAALVGRGAWDIAEPKTPLQAYPDGRLVAARATSRYDRFQAARIAEWNPRRDQERYSYQITANSLQRAAEDGIALRHVRAFLKRATGDALPPKLETVLQRWDARGVEAKLRWAYVLQVRSEEVMEQLRSNAHTRQYLGMALGPLAVEVKARDWQKLQRALLELGILLARDD